MNNHIYTEEYDTPEKKLKCCQDVNDHLHATVKELQTESTACYESCKVLTTQNGVLRTERDALQIENIILRAELVELRAEYDHIKFHFDSLHSELDDAIKESEIKLTTLNKNKTV